MAISIPELTQANSANGSALLVVELDPSGTPSTNSISLANLFGNITVNTNITGTLNANGTVTFESGNTFVSNLHITYGDTPVSSSDSVRGGKIWFDEDYIYAATANNEIKRVSLNSF